MALIKCPECKKKISDTVEKCPHCGYASKDVDKEIIQTKEFKIDKKKIKYIIIGIILLILVIICYKLMFPSNGLANKIANYLEDEGYNCKLKKDGIEREYICKDKVKGGKATYTLSFEGGFTYLLEEGYDFVFNKEEFPTMKPNVNLYLEYELENTATMSLYPSWYGESGGVVFQGGEGDDCSFIPESCVYEDHCNFTVGDEDLAPTRDCDYEYSNYTSTVNKLVEEMEEIIEEFDLD